MEDFDENQLVRLVFREVMAGDIRKFEARSNDTPSGGGARDFRFRPYDKFEGVFEKMLTNREQQTRTRNGKKVIETIYTSTVHVLNSKKGNVSRKIEFEPPTTARENEGRLTRLNKYDLSPPNNEGKVLLLIYQTGNGELYMAFASEQQLLGGLWDAKLTDMLLECLNARRPSTHAAQGFIDFLTMSHYCKCNGY